MPWAETTTLNEMHPTKSNDGPILWMRPGEQSIPTVELGKSPLKGRRRAGINELQNLKYLPRSSTEREIFIEGNFELIKAEKKCMIFGGVILPNQC